MFSSYVLFALGKCLIDLYDEESNQTVQNLTWKNQNQN